MRANPPIKRADLEHIWFQVPSDYYQNGIKKNILQRIWHYGKLRNITKSIQTNNVHSQSILDVGCASGWFLNELSKKFPHALYTGVDVYENAIKFGQKQYKHLAFLQADGHALPFQEKSFDVVICNEVLEHVLDPMKVLSEIRRVLKNNGIAIIEMDTGNFLFKIVWYWWTHLRNCVWKDAHIQTFNIHILENYIIKSGFTIKDKKIFNASMAVIFVLKK